MAKREITPYERILPEVFAGAGDLAVHVVRICVLFEDLRLESSAARHLEPIALLDTTSKTYRYIYFLRRLMVSLDEFCSAVQQINKSPAWKKRVRTIEPYSLRRSKAGHLLVYAVKSETREPRSYRVDRIQSVRLTQRSFTPVYAIEFPAAGPLAAPLVSTTARPSFGRAAPEARYVVECSRCGRTFPRATRDRTIRPHKDSNGWPCPGRRGHFV